MSVKFSVNKHETLQYFALFAQLKKRENNLWRNITISKIADWSFARFGTIRAI